jgi:hypothetical protein
VIQTFRTAGRLAWRPALLSYIYVLGLSVLAPALILGWQLGDSADVLSPRVFHLVVWGQALFFMPALGATVSQLFSSALTKPFILTTPELLTRLNHARLAINVVFALVIAIILALINRPDDAIPAFCCALLFFEFGVRSADPAVPRLQGLAIFIAGVATLIVLRQTIQALESEPVLVSVVALGLSVLLVSRDLSPRRARDMVQNGPTAALQLGNPFTRPIFKEHGQDVSFEGEPESGRLFEWLRALDYEMFGFRRFGTAKELGFFIVFFCVWAYVFSNTVVPALMGILFVSTGRGLVGKIAYPIRRDERATLVFFNGVLRYTAYFGGASIVTWLITSSGLPRIAPLVHMSDEMNGFLALAATFLWTPLTQWLSVKLKLERKMVSFGTNQAKLIVVMLGTMLPAVATASLVPEIHGGLPVQLGVCLLLMIAGHVALWFALKHHYRTADLI